MKGGVSVPTAGSSRAISVSSARTGGVRFRGRLKEMIKTGGINVAPLEVEAILLAHPAVKQAYVERLAVDERVG